MICVNSQLSMKKNQDKRTRILEAAQKVFVEKGFHQTKVADITRRAGIGKGTIYLYFPDKESILFAILTEGMKEIIQIMSQTVSNKKENFLTKIQNLVKDEFEFVENHWELFHMLFLQRVIQTLHTRKVKIKESCQMASNEFRKLMGNLMKQGIREGVLMEYDPYKLGMLFQSLINSFSIQSIIYDSNKNIISEEPFLVDLFLKGAQRRKHSKMTKPE